MLIVPDDSPIEVEAMVLNKDIGFVHEGQDAIVKIETFNFTKYGYIEGRVARVSRDAVIDRERGPLLPRTHRADGVGNGRERPSGCTGARDGGDGRSEDGAGTRNRISVESSREISG